MPVNLTVRGTSKQWHLPWLDNSYLTQGRNGAKISQEFSAYRDLGVRIYGFRQNAKFNGDRVG